MQVEEYHIGARANLYARAVSGNRRHFLVGQGETRTETPSFHDGGLRCLGHGGQDRSGETKNLALFGPVERQVLPLSQPARGELRRLLAVQDGGDDIGREEGRRRRRVT